MGMEKRKTRVVLVAALAVGLLGVTASPAVAGKFVSPTSWNFGTLAIGSTSAPKTFTLTVTCIRSVDDSFCEFNDFFSPVVTTTGDYAVVGNDCPPQLTAGGPPAPPSQSCTVSVSFEPSASGTRSGSLETGGPSAALTGFAPSPPGVATPVPSPTPTPTLQAKKCKKHRSAAAAKKRCKKKKRSAL
jgi:hypothetical protein